MKKFTFLFTLFLLSNTCFSQSGWSWQNPLPQGLNFTKVDFINSTTGFVGGSGYIIKTTDAGK